MKSLTFLWAVSTLFGCQTTIYKLKGSDRAIYLLRKHNKLTFFIPKLTHVSDPAFIDWSLSRESKPIKIHFKDSAFLYKMDSSFLRVPDLSNSSARDFRFLIPNEFLPYEYSCWLRRIAFNAVQSSYAYRGDTIIAIPQGHLEGENFDITMNTSNGTTICGQVCIEKKSGTPILFVLPMCTENLDSVGVETIKIIEYKKTFFFTKNQLWRS